MKILVVLLILRTTNGLAPNPVKDLLARVKGTSQLASVDKKAQGEELLRQLNLQASTVPKPFSASFSQLPNLAAASVPAVLRAGSGVFAVDYKVGLIDRDESKYTILSVGGKQLSETGLCKVPPLPIIVYEFEGCPFCRKVREACSMLSLDIEYRPTPQGGRRYRPEIKDKYGRKASFPFMRDPNNGVEMFESDDIIAYLFKMYGNGQVPWTLQSSPLVPLTAGLGVGLARLAAGSSYQPSNSPPQPVVLWAYEGSPFCKIVREKLSSLELAHKVIFTPRGSPNRQRMLEEKGRFQVPLLEDPNTGVELYESAAIVEYLQKQYGVDQPTVDYM